MLHLTQPSNKQYPRRDSISSTSSGDSGTPIDGPYDGSTAIHSTTSYKVCLTNFATDKKTSSNPQAKHLVILNKILIVAINHYN